MAIHCSCQVITDDDVRERVAPICADFKEAGRKISAGTVLKKIRQQLVEEGRPKPSGNNCCGVGPLPIVQEAIIEAGYEPVGDVVGNRGSGCDGRTPFYDGFVIPDAGALMREM